MHLSFYNWVINMATSNFLGSVLGGLLNSNNLQDYQHAARTFKSNNYALLPKTKRWWHIVFEINGAAKALIDQVRLEMGGSDKLRYGSADWSTVAGNTQLSVLVKSVKLPSYKFETKKLNQYNRQIINVSKINYDPIQVVFHDDSLNLIRNFWDAYYVYYGQDSRYRRMQSIVNQGLAIPDAWTQDNIAYSSLYTENFTQHWGLDTVNGADQALDRSSPFFDSIKIYHFSRPVVTQGNTENAFPHYAEYTLVNPVITGFEHDSLDYTSADSCVNNMTIEYETVLYAQGVLDSNSTEISSWSAVNRTYYDNSASPLGSPQANIFGSQGILSTGSTVIGDIQSGNLLGAALTAGRAVTTWKNSGGINGLTNSLNQEGRSIINNSLTVTQQNAQYGSKNIAVP
jgi:hypothetical protein